MPACQHATTEVLACWGTSQQHRQTSILAPPPSLAGHQPACQHASMLQLGVPACWHAGVHASTGMPSIRGCTRGCWACGHSPNLIVLGRSSFEPIQMPICMELGSSVHLEALVSMIELRKQFNTGGPRNFPKLHVRYIRMCLSEI